MIILPIDPRISDGVVAGRGTTHVLHTPASKMIITDAARSGARVFRTPGCVSWTYKDGTTPRNSNTSISSPRLNFPVLIVGGTTVSPTIVGCQDIGVPKGPPGPVEVRNAQIFHTSVNVYLTKNGDPTPDFSKLIGK